MHKRIAPPLLVATLLVGACHPTQRDIAQLETYKRAQSGAPLLAAAGCNPGNEITCDAVHLVCAELHIVRSQACRKLENVPTLPSNCALPSCIENSLNSATALLPETAEERFELAWDRLEIADGRVRQSGAGQPADIRCQHLKEARTLAALAKADLEALKPELDKAPAADPIRLSIAWQQAQVLPVQIDLALNDPTRKCQP